MLKKLKSKKGFTLAELLIVMMIILILAAIGMGVFNSAMERARETADIAALRSSYAEFMSYALLDKKDSQNVGGMTYTVQAYKDYRFSSHLSTNSRYLPTRVL